jgi:hypothetical protein
MARIGSVAAAPFVGDEFASLYVGATRVPTVPGKPVITSAYWDTLFSFAGVLFETPVPDGGSAVTSLRFYINGVLTSPIGGVGGNRTFSGDRRGDQVRMSAVNALGEGPLSDTATFPI